MGNIQYECLLIQKINNKKLYISFNNIFFVLWLIYFNFLFFYLYMIKNKYSLKLNYLFMIK